MGSYLKLLKTLWIIILWSLLGAVDRAAQEPVDPPRLRIEPAGKVDLGSLGPRERKVQRYTFTNTSSSPIALRVFDLSPGVTVAGPALRGPIAPRAAAELELRMDATDWLGFQSRNVRLGTDDPRQGTYYLPTEMVVRPDLTVDGARREFGDVAAPGSAQQAFTFTRETGEPVVLKVAQTLPPYLEMEAEEGHGSARLIFTLRPARIPPGVLLGFEQVRVETNAPQQRQFDLYLGWRIHHPIDAAPSRMVFMAGERSRVLTMTSHEGKPFRILKAEVEGAGFQVAGAPKGGDPRQVLTLLRTAEGQALATLVLSFQGEDEPLKIPLAYYP